MKKTTALCITLVFVLFSACQRGEDTYDASPEANVNALWEIMDRRYCFISYKENELGFRWADVRGKYMAQVTPSMTRLQLFEVLCNMLAELRDGHVNLYTAADVGRYWSWKDDYPLNLDTEVRDQYLGKDYMIAGGLKYRILDDNIGYIVCGSFSSGFGDGNLDDVLYKLRLCRGLILDVRGNTGGDLTYSERLCRRFAHEKTLVGYTMHKTGTGHDDFSAPEPEYIEPSKGIRWHKRTVVLANRSCYSAANTFVRNMKEMPDVTVMGDSTGGGSGLPFSSELPIGWSVRFSACPSLDANMRHTEFGIAPDVNCQLDEAQCARGIDSIIENARSLLSGQTTETDVK